MQLTKFQPGEWRLTTNRWAIIPIGGDCKSIGGVIKLLGEGCQLIGGAVKSIDGGGRLIDGVINPVSGG